MAVWSKATAPSCYGHKSALAHLPTTIFIGNCLQSVPTNQIIFCFDKTILFHYAIGLFNYTNRTLSVVCKGTREMFESWRTQCEHSVGLVMVTHNDPYTKLH